MRRKLNLALIGAGRRGRGAHLPAILKLADVYNFVAVCDADQDTVDQIVAETGVSGYTNVRDLVDQEDLDVVDVCVPADAHHAVCCFVADAGINIIVETPITPTLPMADLMIEAAKRNQVKLEVAENYHRAPRERIKTALIEAGVIGQVSRIYRIFYEGGAHGMSMLRIRAGAAPKSILGIAHPSPVASIIDRMKRHHTQENWSLAYLDFVNQTSATMIYSNVIHARSLGRGQGGVSQIDGTEGTIVGDAVYVVPADDMESGARGIAYQPQFVSKDVAGETVLERIEVALPDQTIAWENPYADLNVTERQVALVDELMSIANAVAEDKDPTYGAVEARFDVEMNLAMQESGLRDREVLTFPLASPSQIEQRVHQRFREEYGLEPEEVDPLLDVFYPRR